ncbi:MAG: ATP-binding cassette domain-containing protein [Deltaproteobacteria bacterium]|nr:ATP-binding cassette domain-containing protein [Deltaproteobacteria bacterium]
MIELKDVHKTYLLGGAPVRALRGVSLSIESGDFVAIMGPSGSGKSTLLHLLGLLDTPDQGSYRLFGDEISGLNENELAKLRSNRIGFVFQQFNLLPRVSALENVELPLLYAGHRFDRSGAQNLLERVGLGERLLHRPNQLSGGQQQRVAIARALINQPSVILADEPTGNLDSAAAVEIVELLKKLNAQGITLVIVTHEEEIAAHAARIIRLRDGVIQSDQRLRAPPTVSRPSQPEHPPRRGSSGIFDLFQYVREGLKALCANKIRSALSALGILIGVGSVVAMLALGHGAQESIRKQLAGLGSNLLVLRSGAFRRHGVVLETGAVTRLSEDDATRIRKGVPGVKEVCASVNGRGQVSYARNNWSTEILGTEPSYARIRSALPLIGRFLTEDENRSRRRVAVIGTTVLRQLFGDANPIGETIKINKGSFQVIGVLPERGATGWRDQDDIIIVPLKTAMRRLLGKDYVDSIDIEAVSAEAVEQTRQAVQDLMISRHRVPLSQQEDAFEVRSMAEIQEAVSGSSRTMGFLLASIAAISLLVGGIGIMNIMLVSVTERTREIGLRKALGARRRDLMLQFLAEAVVVSVTGGALGILLGCGATWLLTNLAGWTTSVSPASVALAFFFSAAVGIIFGLYPARKAAVLSPIDALRYE